MNLKRIVKTILIGGALIFIGVPFLATTIALTVPMHAHPHVDERGDTNIVPESFLACTQQFDQAGTNSDPEVFQDCVRQEIQAIEKLMKRSPDVVILMDDDGSSVSDDQPGQTMAQSENSRDEIGLHTNLAPYWVPLHADVARDVREAMRTARHPGGYYRPTDIISCTLLVSAETNATVNGTHSQFIGTVTQLFENIQDTYTGIHCETEESFVGNPYISGVIVWKGQQGIAYAGNDDSYADIEASSYLDFKPKLSPTGEIRIFGKRYGAYMEYPSFQIDQYLKNNLTIDLPTESGY